MPARRLLCILVLIGLLGCANEQRAPTDSRPQGTPIDPRARILLNEAHAALGRGDLQNVLAQLEQAEQYQPGLPEVTFLRGHVALAMNRLPAAREAFETVLARQPGYEAAWHSLGDVAYAEGDYREAIRYYRREDATNPTPQTWYNIGNAFRMLEMPDSALVAFERSVDLDRKYADSYVAMAEVREARGAHDEALRHAESAYRIDPSDPRYAYLTGRLLFQLGRLDEAEDRLRTAVASAPWDYSTLYTLGQVLQRQGDPEATTILSRAEEARRREAEVRNMERQASQHRDSALAHVALAQELVSAGRLHEALERFKIAQVLDPADLSIRQNIASLLLATGATQEAVTACEEILASDSLRVGAWVIMSAAYSRIGDKDQSLRAWQRAVRIDPNHPAVQQALGAN
jgi:tetratricopeptide (TPR) repeat protein